MDALMNYGRAHNYAAYRLLTDFSRLIGYDIKHSMERAERARHKEKKGNVI